MTALGIKLLHVLPACVTYAAALERQAYSLAAEIAQQDIEQLQNMPEQHVAAAGLFRKAAGVYQYAADEFVDQLTGLKQADRYGQDDQIGLALACEICVAIYQGVMCLSTPLTLQTCRTQARYAVCARKTGIRTGASCDSSSGAGQRQYACSACISLLWGDR